MDGMVTLALIDRLLFFKRWQAAVELLMLSHFTDLRFFQWMCDWWDLPIKIPLKANQPLTKRIFLIDYWKILTYVKCIPVEFRSGKN